jgi:hypothetical protein
MMIHYEIIFIISDYNYSHQWRGLQGYVIRLANQGGRSIEAYRGYFSQIHSNIGNLGHTSMSI